MSETSDEVLSKDQPVPLKHELSDDWSRKMHDSYDECAVFQDEEDHKRNATEDAPTKLFITLAHGLFGSRNDFERLRQFAEEKFPDALVLVSTINTPSTTSGIRSGGRRYVYEIVKFLTKHYKLPCLLTKKAKRHTANLISELENARAEIRHFQRNPGTSNEKFRLVAIGHSLGGLYTRYALGILYRARFFHPEDGILEPFEYMSISTPHLGSRRPSDSNDKVGWVLKHLMAMSTGLIQTVKDLTLEDDEENPILLEMSDPSTPYYKALSLFTLTAFSTTHFDKIVPFASSAVMIRNPFTAPSNDSRFLVAGASGFPQRHLKEICKYVDEDSFLYKKTYSTEALDVLESMSQRQREKEYVADEENYVELHPCLYENLRQLKWRRIHVQFPTGNTIEELFMHQTPLAKGFNSRLEKLFGFSGRQEEAEEFLQLVLSIIQLDIEQPKQNENSLLS